MCSMRGYIVGGFGSTKWYYTPLKVWLRQEGMKTEFLNQGCLGLNIWPLDNFTKESSNILDEHKEPVFVIGHSLGGIQAIWLAHLFPEKIAKVFAVGSPVYGTPLQVYEDVILRLLEVSPDRWKEFKEEIVPSVADKIITICSPEDLIAPPDRCLIKGAKNYLVTSDDSGFTPSSHLFIPYLSATIEVVRNELEPY